MTRDPPLPDPRGEIAFLGHEQFHAKVKEQIIDNIGPISAEDQEPDSDLRGHRKDFGMGCSEVEQTRPTILKPREFTRSQPVLFFCYSAVNTFCISSLPIIHAGRMCTCAGSAIPILFGLQTII